MDIKIFEMVCWGGSKLGPIVDAALDKLNLDYDFDLISNLPEIAKSGITNLPTLMINGEIKIEGKIPTVDEVVEVLKSIENF